MVKRISTGRGQPRHPCGLDGETAALFLHTMVPAGLVDRAFVCGPRAMIDDVEGALATLGLPREPVHVGRFTPSEPSSPAKPGRPLAG
ncbi:hypothetical protein [Methylobacterium tarhaniae]|uniref:hypothetical protein n=1 Tax=Methylobacterium tarhaniae TaxID=1187852 RepID=UPI000A721098|nr:hypothetical protein [Methylobacterium tarhaniae]